jgi:hypothetical protein
LLFLMEFLAVRHRRSRAADRLIGRLFGSESVAVEVATASRNGCCSWEEALGEAAWEDGE